MEGGTFLQNSDVQAEKCRLIFIDNYSKSLSGAIFFYNLDISSVSVLSGNFTDNIAGTVAGIATAVYINNMGNITFRDTNFKNSSMYIVDSNVTFKNTTFINSTQRFFGGGIYSSNSILQFEGYNLFDGNTAISWRSYEFTARGSGI